MAKRVVVELPPVVDAMAKSVGLPAVVEVAIMERFAYGEVVPRPKKPEGVIAAANCVPAAKPIELPPTK